MNALRIHGYVILKKFAYICKEIEKLMMQGRS